MAGADGSGVRVDADGVSADGVSADADDDLEGTVVDLCSAAPEGTVAADDDVGPSVLDVRIFIF
jgi:hypothetical protein